MYLICIRIVHVGVLLNNIKKQPYSSYIYYNKKRIITFAVFSCENPFVFVKILKECPHAEATYREAKIYVMRYWEGQ